MSGQNEKAAEGQTRAASDTAGRHSNHTRRQIFAQCMRDTAEILFERAIEDAARIGTLEPIDRLRKGTHILRTLRGALTHSCVARAAEGR